MKRSLAVVLSISVAGTGCSFAFTSGPGAVGNPPQVYPDCTESLTWPVVDGIIAASMLLSGAGVVGATHDSSDSSTEDGATAGAVTAVLLAVGFGASAYLGYGRVSHCGEVREAFMTAHPNGVAPAYGGGGGYYPPAPALNGVGQQGGFCTPQNTCDPGLVCSGMPDRTNKCIVAPQSGPAVGAQGGACTPQLTCDQGLVCSGMPDHTNKCIAAQPTAPAAPAAGAQGGACTAQLTCNTGLVCAGMPDHTNKCMPAPQAGTQGGACMANNACNTGLVCAGMPDHTNKCMPAR